MNQVNKAIANIKEMMNAKRLDYLLLDQVVRTNWPGDDRPYNIREIEFDREKDILYAHQRWDQEQTCFQVDHFDDDVVAQIEKEVERSMSMLKWFRVHYEGTALVQATNPSNVSKTVKYHYPDLCNSSITIKGNPDEVDN